MDYRNNNGYKSTPNADQAAYEEHQKRHHKTCIILRCIGIPLLIIGGALSIAGFVSFFIAFNSMQGQPRFFWLSFIGMPLFGVGLFLTIFSFTSALAKFSKDASTATLKEGYQDLRPEIKDFTNGLRSNYGPINNNVNANNTNTTEDVILCKNCGAMNDAGDKFCKKCGAPLAKNKCPYCGAVIDSDSSFCSHCGKPIK